MLRLAVQSKGRLYEDTMALLGEADIKVSKSVRGLLVEAKDFPMEVLFLRDDDIPQTVASGVADLGIVGENEFLERGERADIVRRLGFSRCRLSLAVPKSEDYRGLEWFQGKKIAGFPVQTVFRIHPGHDELAADRRIPSRGSRPGDGLPYHAHNHSVKSMAMVLICGNPWLCQEMCP